MANCGGWWQNMLRYVPTERGSVRYMPTRRKRNQIRELIAITGSVLPLFGDRLLAFDRPAAESRAVLAAVQRALVQ